MRETDSQPPIREEPGCGGFRTARDAGNQRRVNRWMLGASLAYLSATAAIRWRDAIPAVSPWLQVLLVGLSVILAVVAIRSYLGFLRAADELLRRIELEALGVGFAAGAVVALLYPLCERLGAPRVGEFATPVVMMLGWAAGFWLATRRYSGGES